MKSYAIASKLLIIFMIFITTLGTASVPAGDAAIDVGDYETAISEYTSAYEQNGSVEALYKLAKAKTYLAGTLEEDAAETLYEEAADHARAAIEAAPENAETHFELARAIGRLAQFKGILESLNMADEVRSELERTIELDSSHGGAYHALALWHLEVPWIAGGRAGQVRPLFDQAIAAEPDAITHYVDYGEALIRLDDKEAARTQLDAALAMSASTLREEADLDKARELLASLD